MKVRFEDGPVVEGKLLSDRDSRPFIRIGGRNVYIPELVRMGAVVIDATAHEREILLRSSEKLPSEMCL
jgi:hypothetical protein